MSKYPALPCTWVDVKVTYSQLQRVWVRDDFSLATSRRRHAVGCGRILAC